MILMSSQTLVPNSTSDENFDIDKFFATLDSLVDYSDDDSELEIDDALQYLHDIAFKCEN